MPANARTTPPTSDALVPETELRTRVGALQRRMEAAGIDVVLVAQNVDLLYLCGSIASGYMVVPASGEPVLHLRRALDRTAAETCWRDLRLTRSTRELAASLDADGLADGTIGLELDVLPAGEYLKLVAALPGARPVDATAHLRAVRALKSTWELERAREAAIQVRAAFAAVEEEWRPGMREIDVAIVAEHAMREAGHQGVMRMRRFNGEMFYGQVVAGAAATLAASLDAPLGGAGRYPAVGLGASTRPIEPGDVLIVDLMGASNGYMSDCTRAYAIGDVAPELATGHRWCIDTFDAIAAIARPGVAPSSLYAHALERARGAGHVDRFMGIAPDQARFVGHGVGLEVDEPPFLASGFDDPLEPGMVFALEPKLVFAGLGAVGVEDTCIVTDTGVELLDAPPRELRSLPA